MCLVYLLVGRYIALVAIDAIQPLPRPGHPWIAVFLVTKAQDVRFGVAFEKVRRLLGEDVRRKAVETRRLRVDIRRPVCSAQRLSVSVDGAAALAVRNRSVRFKIWTLQEIRAQLDERFRTSEGLIISKTLLVCKS